MFRLLHISMAAVLIGGGWGTTLANQQQAQEFELKARLLKSLCAHITWPRSPENDSRPFIIGVLGDNPFERHLEEQTWGKKIQDRKISVVYLRTLNPAALRECNVLFISESESDRMGEVLRLCLGYPILTISDTPGFSARGVMVSLVLTESSYISLEVNLKSVRSAKLEIGSAVLTNARTRIIQSP